MACSLSAVAYSFTIHVCNTIVIRAPWMLQTVISPAASPADVTSASSAHSALLLDAADCSRRYMQCKCVEQLSGQMAVFPYAATDDVIT